MAGRRLRHLAGKVEHADAADADGAGQPDASALRWRRPLLERWLGWLSSCTAAAAKGYRTPPAGQPDRAVGRCPHFLCADLQPDFDQPPSAANPVLATEFCGGSVTSSSRPQARTDRILANNRHLKFGRSDCRGFMLIELGAARANVRFQRIDDIQRADSPASTLAAFVVEDGRVGVVQAG